MQGHAERLERLSSVSLPGQLAPACIPHTYPPT